MKYLISYISIGGKTEIGSELVNIDRFESKKMDETTLAQIQIHLKKKYKFKNVAILGFNKLEG